MLFGMMSGLGRGTACYVGVMIPEGAIFGGKHLSDKPNTTYNCKLDWSMQPHTTGADA